MLSGDNPVLETLDEVDRLVKVHKTSSIKHRLAKEHNYISSPRRSGYRGVHLIYRYYSDKSSHYNGLLIEMQFRSAVQHAWATAVETVGTLVQQALKSSIGEDDWLRFFALMGTAIAWRESAPPVPGTPSSPNELVDELRGYAEQRALSARLKTFGAALHTAEQSSASEKTAKYFLLTLDPNAQEVTVSGYTSGELDEASREYLAVEKKIKDNSGQDAVLVSVDSLASLRRAYPNYFLDTTMFVKLVDETLGRSNY